MIYKINLVNPFQKIIKNQLLEQNIVIETLFGKENLKEIKNEYRL